MTRLLGLGLVLLMACVSQVQAASSAQAKPGIDKATLGMILFNDPSLSNPSGLSCARCHDPSNAFADPRQTATSEGAIAGRFGSRNTPSLLYAALTPPLRKQSYDDEWVGGLFWDGRVDSLAEQALQPLLNPLEMNNTPASLATSLRNSTYINHFVTLYGEAAVKQDQQLIEAAADALAAFQQTPQFTPFTAKYDYYEAGIIPLSEEEARGFEVFGNKGACIDCHTGRVGERQLFTQFAHHNITTPPNKALAFYTLDKSLNPAGKAFIDRGLALNPKIDKNLLARAQGAFKTPTLRNIAVTAPYMHNGVFKTLREVIDFYANMEPFWPAEVAENRSRLVSSQVNLSETDKNDLIAFMTALTDGYPATPEQQAALARFKAANP